MLDAISLMVEVNDNNFDETSYLSANPDVKASVIAGVFKSGAEHFERHGRKEGRKIRLFSNLVDLKRKQKLNRIRQYLRSDLPSRTRDGKPDFLSAKLIADTRIVDTDNVSSNSYDADTLGLIKKFENGLVLDCGAGRRDVYFNNVINYEVVNYDTTDVIGVGEALPFKDKTFDAVISIAVLEHVRDPFLCAREISRVLKPGGELLCAMPFLQPYHGYPHHYFNATHDGLRRLFEEMLNVTSVRVPNVGHPAFALNWFLRSWRNGLPEELRKGFEGLTISDIISQPPDALAVAPTGKLSELVKQELACGFVLRAVK